MEIKSRTLINRNRWIFRSQILACCGFTAVAARLADDEAALPNAENIVSLHAQFRVPYSWGMVERTLTCPIVHEGMEEVKKSLDFPRKTKSGMTSNKVSTAVREHRQPSSASRRLKRFPLTQLLASHSNFFASNREMDFLTD